MLRRLAAIDDTGGFRDAPQASAVNRILEIEPARLALLLEASWQLRARGRPTRPESYWFVYALGSLGLGSLDGIVSNVTARYETDDPHRRLLFDHLIYAYMIENTRAYEIFSRVALELLHGERLGLLQTEAAYRWLRTTEELFLKDASPFLPQAVVSKVRPDIRASRRNAYYRMFGMDLNHAADQTTTYPYQRAEAANREFVSVLEDFLREVWRGIENSRNTSGPDITDPATIANLALRLQNMMTARRGTEPMALTLAREEFEYVTTMAWFHLTLLFNTPVITDLKVTATSPEERLRLLGEKVGIPAHARSHSYLLLAPALSTLLIQIEAGHYSTSATARNLYILGTPTNPIREMLASIITQWSMATGRDLKSPRVTVGSPPPRIMAGAPATTALPAAPTNGRTPAGTAA
jgi:hypothetical protein